MKPSKLAKVLGKETLEYCNVRSARREPETGQWRRKEQLKIWIGEESRKGVATQICGLRYEGIITATVGKRLQITWVSWEDGYDRQRVVAR
jgi:hypothetical protein